MAALVKNYSYTNNGTAVNFNTSFFNRSFNETKKTKMNGLIETLAHREESLLHRSFLPKSLTLKDVFPITATALSMESSSFIATAKKVFAVAGAAILETLFLVPKMLTAPISLAVKAYNSRELKNLMVEANITTQFDTVVVTDSNTTTGSNGFTDTTTTITTYSLNFDKYGFATIATTRNRNSVNTTGL